MPEHMSEPPDALTEAVRRADEHERILTETAASLQAFLDNEWEVAKRRLPAQRGGRHYLILAERRELGNYYSVTLAPEGPVYEQGKFDGERGAMPTGQRPASAAEMVEMFDHNGATGIERVPVRDMVLWIRRQLGMLDPPPAPRSPSPGPRPDYKLPPY
ncbi:MAG TPA: hypothetical protein VLF67_02545 [Candidatus Saccharimonas sp.]|nr:hypothetical protein [Candidatus Saccharimonas sp.]